MRGGNTMHCMKMEMFAFVSAAMACGAVFAKTDVPLPILDEVEYNGAVQTATVPDSDKWQIVFSENGEHVGTYDTFLRIIDFDNFKWAGTDERTIAVPFRIVKAQNSWTAAPSISNWTFGGVPSSPIAVAKFGAVAPVVYNGTTVGGSSVSGAAAVSDAGNYTAVFNVAGSDDYTALHEEVPFTVSPRNVSGNDLVVSVGTNPKYNGEEHTLPITSVTFNGVDIPYSVSGNKATHAGTYTLSVTAGGNYTGTTNIEWKVLPRSVTLTSGSESRAYNSAMLTKNEVMVSGDGFVGTDGAAYSVTGSRTDVGTSDNDFTYELNPTTVSGDYLINAIKGKLTVTKADNSWEVEPSATDKTYDGSAYVANTGTPAFGTATVKFSGAAFDGTAVSDVETVVVPGTYTAKFDVAETSNYTGLHKELQFAIMTKDISGEDFVVSVGPDPKYNGGEQTISIQSVTYKGSPISYTVSGDKGINAGAYTLIVSASGMFTGSKNVVWNIQPRSVTLTSGSASCAYDGTALTKNAVAVSGDGFVGAEGATYSVTGSRTDAGTSDNDFTYALKSGTLAANYQISTVKGTLTVTKATNSWTAQPTAFGKTYDGTAVAVSKGTAKFGTVAVSYSPGGSVAPKDAGSYTATFSVAGNANYTALSKDLSITITQRNISNATIGSIPNQTETGSLIQPSIAVTDGAPSIISTDDYTVVFSGNVSPGTALVTLTGKRNYTGTKTATFTIVPKPVTKATLSGEARWRFLRATGTYFAQLKVRCTGGYSAGISNLRIGFVDKAVSGAVLAQLWDSSQRNAVSATSVFEGTTYRIVSLASSSITGENVDATYGISSISVNSIPVGERAIELYVPKRDLASHLSEYVAYIIWESKGVTYAAPVTNKSVQ